MKTTKNKKKKSDLSMGDLRAGNNKTMVKAMKELAIKEELNKLFYLPPKYDEELEMLEYQYAQEEEERVGLHLSAVSSAGVGFCYREQMLSLIYKRNDESSGTPINLARIYEEGKSIGTKWQRLFIRGGLGVKEDMDVSRMVDKWELSYTPDAIINLFGEKHVVEIKSMNTNQFQTTKGHPSGEKQLRAYMYLEGIKHGFVLVEDKNNQDFKIIYVSNVLEDDDDIVGLVQRLDKIQKQKNKFIEEKKAPKRHIDCTNEFCPKAKRCPMSDACWGRRREKF